jgi:hypothetical protein
MRPARLGGGHPLHAVHTPLELEPAPSALALDGEDDLLEAALPRRVRFEHLELEAVALGVLRVHPRQVGGEERGLVPTRARTDLDEDVLVVARVAGDQHRPQHALRVPARARATPRARVRQLDEIRIALA